MAAEDCSLLVTAGASPSRRPTSASRFTTTSAMIPMRDGVRLNTAVYVPRNVKGPLPFLLLRTPYGIEDRARAALQGYL